MLETLGGRYTLLHFSVHILLLRAEMNCVIVTTVCFHQFWHYQLFYSYLHSDCYGIEGAESVSISMTFLHPWIQCCNDSMKPKLYASIIFNWVHNNNAKFIIYMRWIEIFFNNKKYFQANWKYHMCKAVLFHACDDSL